MKGISSHSLCMFVLWRVPSQAPHESLTEDVLGTNLYIRRHDVRLVQFLVVRTLGVRAHAKMKIVLRFQFCVAVCANESICFKITHLRPLSKKLINFSSSPVPHPPLILIFLLIVSFPFLHAQFMRKLR